MDSGIVCTYYSVDEAIESGAAPVPLSLDRTLDVQCTIDIMDHLLACEVRSVFLVMIGIDCPLTLANYNFAWQATWHEGHLLAQTVFSCIYLLKPDRTASHALLHSYCRVIRATCNLVVSVVSDARTHEVKYSATLSPFFNFG